MPSDQETLSRINMTKAIQKLTPGVVKKLRSGIAFTNVAHCVEELVLNSIDAEANCIAVNLNLPFYQIQVIDNGCGISEEQMKIIGTRYATSKCHTLEDLQNLKCGGFRGEALSSLKEVSSAMVIESRIASSSETYCKMFTQGKALDSKKSLNSRPSKGTTVTVYDFLYNMPVRKKSISDALDLEECRKLLQSIALMYPNISFTLKNEATDEMCLQLKKCTSLYHSFLQMFGTSKANNLKNIAYQRDNFEISGCISTECYISKDLQFLYVNKRHVLRTKLHKLVNSMLNKALTSKQKSNVNTSSDTPSPSKNQCYCIFAINISCPYNTYDIIFEPRKTMIEFSEWDSVLKVVEDALIDFLKRENLYSAVDEVKSNALNSNPEEDVSLTTFEVQDCQQGLFSHVVRRLKFSKSMDFSTNGSNLKQNEESCVFQSLIDKDTVSQHGNKSIRTSTESCTPGYREKLQPYNQKDNSCCNNNANNSLLGNSLQETELNIPCRSVFPSENPIMLRVPTKSALSDLQTSSSNLKLLQMKEKLQCFVRKENTYPLGRSKFQEKYVKNLQALSNQPEKFSEKKNSPVLYINEKQDEAKLRKSDQLKVINKSSQCPSVSEICKNAPKAFGESGVENKSSVKETRDKSFQCPSTKKQIKVFSRFTFKEQSNVPLKFQKQSKRSQKRTTNKPCMKNATVTDNLPDCSFDDNKVSKAKKLKPSHPIQGPGIVVASAAQDIEILDPEVSGINLEIEPNFKVCRSDPHANIIVNCVELCTDSSKKVNMHQNKIMDLNKSKSLFDLQTFSKTDTLKEPVDVSSNIRLENSHHLEKEKFFNQYNDDITNCNSQIKRNSFHQFFFSGVSNDILNSANESNENECCFLDKNPNFKENKTAFVTEDTHMEIEALSEKNITNNVLQVNSDHVSPSLTDIVCNIIDDTNSNCNDEDNLQNISNKIHYGSGFDSTSKTFIAMSINQSITAATETPVKSFSDNSSVKSSVLEIQSVCDTDFKSDSACKIFAENPVNDFVTASKEKLDEPQLDCNTCISSVLDGKSTCNINFESNPFTETFLTAPFNNTPVFLKEKVDESHSGIANHMPSVLEVESISNNNFESYPFTEKVIEVQENVISLGGSNTEANKKSDDNILNCSSQELFAKQSASELPDEILKVSADKDKASDVSNIVTNMNTDGNFPACHEEDNRGSLGNNIVDIKSEMYSCWKLHSQPESKRKMYIDAVTGNSTYNIPEIQSTGSKWAVEPNNGVLKKSHFFLTHDYSPFISKTQTPDKFKNYNCCIQNDLKNFVEYNEKSEMLKKWKVCQDPRCHDNIEDMLSGWDNPIFDMPYEATAVDNISQRVSQMHSFLNSYKFSRSTLSSLQVIGQVDCKFIACLLKDFNENCRDQRLLALFDQHAVHERIRLEELIKNLYETDDNGEKSVKTCPIDPPIEVTFSDEEIRLLQVYNEKLHKIGIYIKIHDESHACSVQSVPLCLIHKDTGELRRSISDTINILQNSVTEWLSSVVKTRSVPQVLPKTLSSVLNYQACRSAVKFGDPLSFDQCCDLMKSLSECKLPFQCAHGRPSVAPVLDLNKVDALYKKKPPPQLWTLLKPSKE